MNRSARARDRALKRTLDRERDLALYLDRAREVELALDLARGVTRHFELLSNRDRALARDLARDLDLAPTRDRDLARDIDFARAIALARDLVRALVLALDRDCDRNLALDLALGSAVPAAHGLVMALEASRASTRYTVRALLAEGEQERSAGTGGPRLSWMAGRVLGRAAGVLPVLYQSRYEDEFHGELAAIAQDGGGRWAQWCYAVSVLGRSLGLRVALRGMSPEVPERARRR